MSLDLVPDWIVGDLSLTEYPYGVDADSTVDPGNPEARVVEMESMALDGDYEEVSGYGNRVYALTVYVEGPSLGEVAQAEAALRRELRRRDLTLTHDPGDSLSVPSVYEVWHASMAFQREDRNEAHVLRKFRLELKCSPFARSASPTTVAALMAPDAASTVVIDTCDSATGWTGTRGSRATVPAEGPSTAWQAGAVGVAELDAEVTSPEAWSLVRSGTVDLTATPFLVAEMRTLASDTGGRLTVRAWADGHYLPILGATRLTDGYFRVVFDARKRAMPVSQLAFTHASHPGDPWQGLFVRHLERTNVPPTITPRQVSRLIQVDGTERTPASLRVTTEAEDPLGITLIYTWPADDTGYSPPLQRWRTVGQAQTPDSTAYSGTYELINSTSWVAEVPTSALPEGGYTLMARLRAQTAGTVTISWSTSTVLPDSVTQQGFTLGTVDFTFSAANAWHLVPLAVLSLPSVRTASGHVQVALQVAAASPMVALDEAWLFRADDDCALTILETNLPNIWLESPDTASSVPRVWAGDNQGIRVHPGDTLYAMGAHFLTPGATGLFVAAGAANPLAAATYFPRWLHNAAG